jgi:hypothetical protein
MSELLRAHGDIVDLIAESAFIRGKLSARSEVYQQLKDAYNSAKIDTPTYIDVLKILNEGK